MRILTRHIYVRDPSFPFCQHRHAWKERSNMAIPSQAKKNQIETRLLASKEFFELALIFLSSPLWISGTGNWIYLPRRDWHPVQQALISQISIAARIIQRHAPFISPKDIYLIPGHLFSKGRRC